MRTAWGFGVCALEAELCVGCARRRAGSTELRAPRYRIRLDFSSKTDTSTRGPCVQRAQHLQNPDYDARTPERHRLEWSIVLVLALDTSTPTVTAAVVTVRLPHEVTPPVTPDSVFQLEAERSVTDSLAHAEQLMPLASAALGDIGHRVADLDAVVVGLGPGPFTGLRVGIATAAALGDALNIPVHGVPSHDAVAAVTEPGEPFLVATDARRREVYLSCYDAGGRRVAGPVVVAPDAVGELLAEHNPVFRTGAGAALLDGGIPARAVGDSIGLGLVRAAGKALVTGVVPGPLTPLYLRRPDATAPTRKKSVLGK